MTNPAGKWDCKYKCGRSFDTLGKAKDHETKCPKKPRPGTAGHKGRRNR